MKGTALLPHEGGYCAARVVGGHRPQTQGPRVIEILDKRALNSEGIQRNAMLLAAVIARCSLKHRVEAVSAVVDWPESQFVGNGTGGEVDL